MPALEINRLGSLVIDGDPSNMAVTSTVVEGGGATIETVQPELTSESESVFDGWAVWRLDVSLRLIEPSDADRGRTRYAALGAIRAAHRREKADGTPEQWVFSGDLAEAMEISSVIIPRITPITDLAETDDLRLVMHLQQVDPKVALRARDRATAQGQQEEEEEEVDTDGDDWASEEDRERAEPIWGGE